MKTSYRIIALCVAFLVLLGLVMRCGADGAAIRGVAATGHGLGISAGQLAWTEVGVVALLIAALTDYRIWRPYALLFLVLVAMLLDLNAIYTFVLRIAHVRWHGGLSAAARLLCELSKIAIILFLAHHLDRRHANLQPVPFRTAARCPHGFIRLWHGLAKPLLVVVGLAVLALFQPSVATAALILLVGVIMLLLGGVPGWPNAREKESVAAPFFRSRRRLYSLSWPPVFVSLASVGSGLKMQACYWIPDLAFRNGGWTGVGFGNGRMRRFDASGAPPDLVAALIGEEFGFVGLLAVLLVFVVLLGVGIRVSLRAREPYGLLLGGGVVALIGCQLLLHLAGLSLVKGLGASLPFVSGGAAELGAMLFCAGLLMSVARDADRSQTGKGTPE